MKNLTKRILSIVLCCLLICSVPVISSAETSDFSIGDKITLGNYNNEPITWVCVLIDDNGPLFLSEKILCKKEYDAAGESAKYHTDGWGYIRKQYGSSCWEDSNIRQWLNTRGKVEYTHCSPSYAEEDGFLSSFTESELDSIKEVTHQINVNIWENQRTGYCDGGSADNVNPFSGTIDYDEFYHKNVTDKVMLLDYIQTNKIWNSNKEYLSADENYFLGCVSGNCYACYEHVNATSGRGRDILSAYESCGIRPAIYIDAAKKVNDGLVKGSYIGYLALGYSYKKLSNAQKILTDQGYNAANMDLNKGAGGGYVCCGWMNVSTAEEAIRDIRVYVGGDAPDTFLLNGCTYEKVGADSTSICYPGKNGDGAFDLNSKAGGDYLYLYATRDPKAGAPIRQIDFSFEPVKTEWNTVEYLNFGESEPANFNKGAGGATVYMHYYSTDPKSGYGTPEGYNFLEDSYRFVNDESPNIDKKYFSTIFESGTSNLIYKKYHEAGGLCYGFAITTAAIYNGMPDISRFAYLDENIFDVKTATKIRDLKRSNKYITGSAVAIGGNLDDCISLSDYIKYAYIYQYALESIEILKFTGNDALGLLETVKKFTDNNKIGVVINMNLKGDAVNKNAPGGHTVLAVGYDGNDILIDDPNYTDSFKRITIHSDGTWEYKGYNEKDHLINYTTNIHRPYQILLTGNKIVGSDFFNSGTGSAEHYVEGVERLDADYTLASIDATTFRLANNDYIQLPVNSMDGTNNNASTAKLFWIKDSKTIKIDGLTDDVNTIEYGGDDTVISAAVSADSTVELTIDGDTKTAAVNTEKDKINTLTFSVVDDDGNKKGVEISGTASGDLVTAKKTENGITVDGFNDMTITYLKDEEEVSDKKADVKDGREVNITVDDKNETVDTDFVPDSAKCKYCGKVHGDSFIELFVKFFHKIFYLISKLFK